MRDPVCGMHLEKDQVKATSTYLDCNYFFCSTDCQKTFDADPREYLSDSALGA